jgi:hypothetical protein
MARDREPEPPRRFAGNELDRLHGGFELASASLMGTARSSARGVGRMPPGSRVKSSSLRIWRSRDSAVETAGWLMPSRRAACVTLPPVRTASNISSNRRSRFRIVIGGAL